MSTLNLFLKLKYWLLPVFLIFTYFSDVYAQCKIIAPVTRLCRGNSVTFSVNSTADRYEWNSGDGKTESKDVATFLYEHYGQFLLKVTLYNSNNSVKCSDSLMITVYDLPMANMQVGNTIEICYNKDFCFKNLSAPGANNSPLVQYLWLFGDGDLSSQKDPCHRYDISGNYLIYLNVKDLNGCESKIEKNVHVVIGSSMKPKLTIACTDSCPVTYARFINLTDTTGKKITKFIIDFGDGSMDSSIQKRDFSHLYTKDSTFYPSMTVINSLGCRETYYAYTSIINSKLDFTFNISANPRVSCWTLYNTIIFNQPEPEGTVQKKLWSFGDSMSGSANYNTVSWSPMHSYKDPGFYDISLHVENSYCKRDTVLCNFIYIKGPKAIINYPNYKNNYLNKRVIPIDQFIRASSACYNPKGDSIPYTILSKVSPYVLFNTDTFCNAALKSFWVKADKCDRDTSYILKPSGVKKTWDTLGIYYNYWFPGDPFPSGDVYYPPKGNRNSQVMHDTDLYPLNCGAPNYVRFTNSSIKFRGYKAIDDKPPFAPGSMGSDQCRNPSFPWASDSMQHFWDFSDPYALPCTSTKSNVNWKCKFSTEVAPWHFYSRDGCYNAKLNVYDPVTKCNSRDSVYITMQHPDAGWDTSVYDYLNFRTQKLNPPLYPRRGMQLQGKPCNNVFQDLDLTEILPDCNHEDWGVVFDSAADCHHICEDTTYLDMNFDGITDTIFNYRDTCEWKRKINFVIAGKQVTAAHIYKTPGCKTVGLWVKSGDCIDTFWYHNYKYITTLDPAFEVLNPDSLTPFTSLDICMPFRPILTAFVKNQNEIIDFRYRIQKAGSSKVLYVDSCKLVKDTIFLLAEISNPKNTIYYPAISCPDDPINNQTLPDLLKQFHIVDTVYILSLADTIVSGIMLTDPGVYEISSTITNIYGCSSFYRITLGNDFEADFMANDSVLCINDYANFIDSLIYINQPFHPTKLEIDFTGDGKYDSSGFFGFAIPGSNYLYDTSSIYRYSTAGIFDVRLRVTDTFCNVSKVYVKKHYIYVGGVKADFDTLNAPSNCAPQVVGFINKSKLLMPYYYIFDSAGNKKDSFYCDYIKERKWQFGDNKGEHSISYKEHPTHAYTMNGEFDVSLIVSTIQGCVDTVLKPKYIRIDGPKPAFNLLDSIGCVPYTARFVDSSKKVSEWIWQLGDKSQSSGTFSYGDTVPLTYFKAGVYYPSLVGSDSVYNVHMHTFTKCTAIFPDPLNPYAKKFKVTVLPLNKLNFTGDSVICTGQEAFFTDLSDTAYQTIYWYFGDSTEMQTGQGAKVGHVFNIPEDSIIGKFALIHDGEGARCPDKAKQMQVTVKRVIADIAWDSLLKTDPVFCFRNFTRGGTTYEWFFKKGNPSFLRTKDTLYRCTNYYTDTGLKTICLKAVNEIQCRDEDCVDVINHYMVLIDIPNVFTPGNSIGINDTFTVRSKNIEQYNLTIYNRWGSVVWVSNDPAKHWDGNEMEKGKPCSAGTYYYVLNYKFLYLPAKTVSGTITLVR